MEQQQKEFTGKIIMQCFFFFLFLAIIFAIKFNNVVTDQNANDIITVHENELDTRKRVYELEQENEKLKQLIIETSGIPNEKRKALFELKIKQDSVLASMLINDIRTNKEILNLLETDWVFNNDTEFESLKEE